MEEQDQLDLLAYLFAHRGFEQVLPALRQLTGMYLALDNDPENLQPVDIELLIQKIMQNRSWQYCSSHFQLRGRKGIERQLRKLLIPALSCIAFSGRAQPIFDRLSVAQESKAGC